MRREKKMLILIILFTTIGVFAQQTVIPDSIFEKALVDQGIDSDSMVNGLVNDIDIASILELNLRGLGIKDLTGIEGFGSLELLNCEINCLEKINLVSNTKLKELNCSNNELTELNINSNTQLERLKVSRTNIETLNLSQNTQIKELFCSGNWDLHSINLENTDKLITLYITNNWVISEMDLSHCVSLETLFYENARAAESPLNLEKNVNLKLLYIHNFDFEEIDFSNNILLEDLRCWNNGLTALDLKNNIALKFLDCGDKNDDFGPFNTIPILDLTKNINLEVLTCDYIGLKELDITKCVNLKSLNCGRNPLEELDVSSNVQLEILQGQSIIINSINLTKNVNLRILNLSYRNWLDELNLDNNEKLRYLYVSNKHLKKLYVRNGNNDSLVLNAKKCDSLTCVFVDDKTMIPQNWIYEDITTFVNTELECDIITKTIAHHKEEIVLYPNPVRSKIRLKGIEGNEDLKAIIYTTKGVKSEKFEIHNNEIDVSDLAKGVYFIEFSVSGQRIVKTVVKK